MSCRRFGGYWKQQQGESGVAGDGGDRVT